MLPVILILVLFNLAQLAKSRGQAVPRGHLGLAQP
jgi:hypothetical protein